MPIDFGINFMKVVPSLHLPDTKYSKRKLQARAPRRLLASRVKITGTIWRYDNSQYKSRDTSERTRYHLVDPIRFHEPQSNNSAIGT